MNPLPRRKYIVVFGLTIFFLSLWSMWSIMDVQEYSSISRSSDLHSLKQQIQTIEHQLEENKLAMVKLRSGFQDLLKLSQVDNLKKDEQKQLLQQIINKNNNDPALNVPKYQQNFTRYKDDGVSCQVLQHYTPRVDVNMADIYETLPFDDLDGGVWKQGFPIVTNDAEWQGKKLKVFVVPHSHNDPGWLKTYEKYFMDQTRHILDSVVDGLAKDSKRRFIWAEISYLSMWWKIADESRRAKAKTLISNGQLEIVTGGWVMNDEANTHIFAMVDQMIEGHDWISRNLNIKPRSGWAIDPFGHTPTMAYILNKMGLENMLIQRVHYALKKHLAQRQSLEFRWRQGFMADDTKDITCHLMPFYSYDVPHTCGPDPKICCQFDFARLPGTKMTCPWKVPPQVITPGNVAERAALLLDQYRKKSKLFKTDTLLVILGDDFRYSTSKEVEAQFTNYASIFDYVNSHPELNAELRFGTLSEYFDAMQKEVTQRGFNLPSLTGDFFTYNDRIDNFWSGYYTSRPFYKQQDRKLEFHLRGAEILFSLAVADGKEHDASLLQAIVKKLIKARQNLGLFQHHDGITGTSKDAVVVDYGNKMKDSIMDCKEVIAKCSQMLLGKTVASDQKEEYKLNLDSVLSGHDTLEEKNQIKLDPTGKSSTNVVIYNSLTYERKALVRLHVNCIEASVHSTAGEVVPSQINLIWSDKSNSKSDIYELVFIACVPATGLTTYKLSCPPISTFNTPSSAEIHNAEVSQTHAESRGQILVTLKARLDASDPNLQIENEHYLLKFSGTNGLLKSVTTKRDDTEIPVKLDFGVYTAKVGKDKPGAYLFLPTGPSVPHVQPDERPIIRVIKGPLLSEVHVILNHIEHRVSLCTMNGDGLESLGVHITNTVDIRAGMDNKEISMRLVTDVKSNDIFYTDLNGFQIQRRKNYPKKLPIQGNFYPMPGMAYIQDSKTRLSLVTGQPLGVASLASGSLEVILDRRLMQDDNRGVSQGVKDNKLTPNKFVLLLERWKANEKISLDESVSYPSLVGHHTSLELLHPIISMQSNTVNDISDSFNPQYMPLVKSNELPCDLHIFNLRHIMSEGNLNPSKESAMILQRLGLDCRLDSSDYYRAKCQKKKLESNDLSLSLLYSATNIAESNLSLMKTGDTLPLDGSVSIKPMDLQAFRVVLDHQG